MSQIAMFHCRDGKTEVHYTLVCNWRADCPDDSDESFCQHARCPLGKYRCETNGRCVTFEERCVCQQLAAADDADCLKMLEREQRDVLKRLKWTDGEWFRSTLFAVNLNKTVGRFYITDLTANFLCPENHFECNADVRYCVPIFTRCNGYNDCVNGEDERGCQHVNCSGLTAAGAPACV